MDRRGDDGGMGKSAGESVSHASVFARIYRDQVWGPPCGPENAAAYARFVERYITCHRISTVVDLGCGDGEVTASITVPGVSIAGVDVVPGFGQCLDILRGPLPPAGLALIKDVLQHWPNGDIHVMLPRLRAVYPRVLITNSAAGTRTNEDIPLGGFRSLDLTAPPFRWPVREVFAWRYGELKSVVELLTARNG